MQQKKANMQIPNPPFLETCRVFCFNTNQVIRPHNDDTEANAHHLKCKTAEDACYRPPHEPQHQELDEDACCGVIELGA